MSAQSTEQLLNHSLQLLHSGQLPEARAGFRKILKKIPAHTDALHFVGLAHLQMQEYEKGIAAIQQALHLRPDYSQAHYSLGNALCELQRFDEAIACFQRAITSQPGFWQASINLGNMLNLLQRHEDSIAHYQHALALQPDAVEAQIGLGIAYAGLQRYQEAINLYQQAIASRPDIAEAYYNLGGALANLAGTLPSLVSPSLISPSLVDTQAHSTEEPQQLPGTQVATTAQPPADQADVLFNEAIAAFKSAIAIRPGYADAYVGLAQTYSQTLQHEKAATAYTKALTIRPHADHAHRLADLLSGLERFEDAIRYYKLALSIQPDLIETHNSLGVAYSKLKRFDAAIDAYQQALRLNVLHFDALHNMANAWMELKKYNEAIHYYQRALAVDPQFAEAHHGLGDGLKESRQFDAAIASYNQALSINPDFGGTRWNRGLLYLTLGMFEQGWQEYEQRAKFQESSHLADTASPLWLGDEAIAGKTLLVQFEQGFGDAIQMVRYLPQLQRMGTECLLQCPLQLAALVSRSFPDIRIFSDNAIVESIDFHIPIMSLPLAMKTFSESAIPNATPYLTADMGKVADWQKRLAQDFGSKIGLVWRGNAGHKNDAVRSAKLLDYIPLIQNNPEVLFVSLQKDLSTAELELLKSHANVQILDQELSDFDVSAAVMRNLDLVITIDSAPAHLAGALNIPLWILLSHAVEWRWLIDRDDTPWYPSARLFRQHTLNNWQGVISKVDTELKKIGEVVYG